MTLCQYSGPGLKGLGTFFLVLTAQSCHIKSLAIAGASVQRGLDPICRRREAHLSPDFLTFLLKCQAPGWTHLGLSSLALLPLKTTYHPRSLPHGAEEMPRWALLNFWPIDHVTKSMIFVKKQVSEKNIWTIQKILKSFPISGTPFQDTWLIYSHLQITICSTNSRQLWGI